MQAIQFKQFGPPQVLEITDVPLPDLSSDQLLVRVHAAGLNPIDWKTRSGLGFVAEQIKDTLPWTPGYDFSGVVEKCGKNKDFQPGDAVFGMNGPGINAGCYAEYLVVSVNALVSKPSNLDHTHAAGVPLAALTAWQALFETGKLKSGETVLIHAAAGGVGHFAVQFAHLYGARVIATASLQNHSLLQSLGADQCIDYNQQDFTQSAQNVDLVIDGVGGETGMRSLHVLSPNGRLVCLPTISAKQIQARAQELGLNATGMMVKMDAGHLRTIAGLLAQGKIEVYINKIYPLQLATKAHHHLETGHVTGKLVLDVSS